MALRVAGSVAQCPAMRAMTRLGASWVATSSRFTSSDAAAQHPRTTFLAPVPDDDNDDILSRHFAPKSLRGGGLVADASDPSARRAAAAAVAMCESHGLSCPSQRERAAGLVFDAAALASLSRAVAKQAASAGHGCLHHHGANLTDLTGFEAEPEERFHAP